MHAGEGNPVVLVANRKKRRLVRVVLWIIFTVIILGGVGFVVVKKGYAKPLIDRYWCASVIIKAEGTDKVPVSEATISVGGRQYTTDSSGRVTLTTLAAGSYRINVAKTGFVSAAATIALGHGENPLEIFSLALAPIKRYAVKGYLTDYLTGKPVAGVQATLGTTSVTTDPTGAYDFPDNPDGTYSVTLHSTAYLDKTISETIKDADAVDTSITVVPSGSVVFVSNRAGGRGIYRANYDGSGQVVLVPRASGEDYAPVLSAGQKLIAFSSTRDGISDAGGNPLVELYLSNADGSGVKKVSTTVAASFEPTWSPNGNWLYYQGYTDATEAQQVYSIFNPGSGATLQIGEEADSVVFSPDSSEIAYTTPTTQDGVNVTQLKTLNLTTGQRKVWATRPQGISDLRFLPDGSAITYQVLQDTTTERFEDLFTTGAESSLPALTDSKRQYVLSPDGSLQAFVEDRNGKTDLFVVDKNGEHEQQLTTIGYADDLTLPVWDPSGAYIVFATNQDGNSALNVIAASGGTVHQVVDFDPDH